MNKDQLLSLTLRQLRQEASKLSVPLYSRKTKVALVDLIIKYQEKSEKKHISVQLSQNLKKLLSPILLTVVKKSKQMWYFYPETLTGLMFSGKFLMRIERKHNPWARINYVYDYLMRLVLREEI